VLLVGKAASAAGCCRLTCSMQGCLAAGASVLGQLFADGLAAAVLVGVVRLVMLCPGGQSAESPDLHKCTQQTPSIGSEVVLVNQTGDLRKTVCASWPRCSNINKLYQHISSPLRMNCSKCSGALHQAKVHEQTAVKCCTQRGLELLIGLDAGHCLAR
jgi:hypothetical protein